MSGRKRSGCGYRYGSTRGSGEMKAYRCDMCGEFLEGEPAVTIERESYLLKCGDIKGVRHLCPGCWAKIAEFIGEAR